MHIPLDYSSTRNLPSNVAMNFSYTQAQIAAVELSLSKERFAPYVTAQQGDRLRALKLYEANTLLSEALYGSLQGLEVTLRNAIHAKLSSELGRSDWFDTPILQQYERQKVGEVKARLAGRNPLAAVPPGQVVATLTFGFWASLTNKSYHRPLWRPYLAHVFANGSPGNDEVRDALRALAELRNRIAHHEPIVFRAVAGKLQQQNLNGVLQTILKAAGWISPETASWIRSQSRLSEVYQRISQPFSP